MFADVSLYFAALTFLLWLEYLFRNVKGSPFGVALYICLDVALGTTFASMLAFPLRLAFGRE